MKSAGSSGDPDFPGWPVPVDDDLRAILELDLEDPFRLKLDVGIHAARFKRLPDVLQGGLREAFKIELRHAM
jgi:hypothetical protein